jgi:hypothetical protein
MQRVRVVNGQATVNVKGKVLVIPSGDSAELQCFNEYPLNSNRLTTAESPFGGIKGVSSPDFGVGTVYVKNGDGMYITDINGNNSTKTMTAGKLYEVSSLTIDKAAAKITEEFIISNTNLGNTPDPIDSFPSVPNGWTFREGSGSFSASNGVLTVDGSTDGSHVHRIQKSFTITDSTEFLRVKIRNSQNANFSLVIWSDDAKTIYKYWSSARFPLTANTDTIFVLPLKAPAHTSGVDMNPDGITPGFDNTRITQIVIGVTGAAGTSNVMTISELRSDVVATASVEVSVPDSLADSSLQIQAHNGSAYQIIGTYKLDSSYEAVGTPVSANWTYYDGTKLDNVKALAPNGRALYPKGISAQTVNGSTGTFTYSANKGTKYRIGLKIDLPPSDNGRTRFSGIRLKLDFTYRNSGLTTYEFEDSLNLSYGLKNMSTAWIALYDPAKSLIDVFRFSHRLKGLSCKKNDSGEIRELVIYPGLGQIYHKIITCADRLTDSNANLIPNFLETAENGSITKLLAGYKAIEEQTIEFISIGQTFAPVIQTTGNPAILWTFSDGSTDTTSTPSKDFGTAAARKHTLKVTPWAGLLTVNVGYDGGDGGETPGSGSNLTLVSPQNVTSINNLQLAHNLTKLACNYNPINTLDLSNLISFQKLECYNSSTLANINLRNLPNLTRLVVEGGKLTELDISECPLLADLRAATQDGGLKDLKILWGDTGAHLWHICIRENYLDSFDVDKFPLIEELYIWDCNLGALGACHISGEHLRDFRASGNEFTSVIIDDECTRLTYVKLENNSFNQAAVDSVLYKLNVLGAEQGTLAIEGNTAPSAYGLTQKGWLDGKGWTVSVDP